MATELKLKKEEILEAHRTRTACKLFDTEKHVSDEDLRFILEIGRLTPSSFGLEPWKFLVIDDENLRKDIYRTIPRIEQGLNTADRLIVILARNSSELRYSSNYVNYILKDVKGATPEATKGIKEGFRKFQDRETNSMYDTMSIYHWSWRQSYLPLATMVSAASEIGVSSCPIEEFNEKDLERILETRGVLDRSKFSVSVLLALGYADDKVEVDKKRRDFDEVVEWIK